MNCFDLEFNPLDALDPDIERPAGERAAEMLGLTPAEVFAGNRHNTVELINIADELEPSEDAAWVEIHHDGYEVHLTKVPTRFGDVVVDGDLIGVFCSEATARAILGEKS